MDLATLAAAAVSFVTPYLLDFGKDAAKEVCRVEAVLLHDGDGARLRRHLRRPACRHGFGTPSL